MVFSFCGLPSYCSAAELDELQASTAREGIEKYQLEVSRKFEFIHKLIGEFPGVCRPSAVFCSLVLITISLCSFSARESLVLRTIVGRMQLLIQGRSGGMVRGIWYRC
jgi:hypothetical protein